MNTNGKLCKKIILIYIILFAIALYTTKTYATEIDSSSIYLNINQNGECNLEEKIYTTAIDEKDAHILETVKYPSMQLTRGDNIENLSINNLAVADYYNRWWPNKEMYGATKNLYLFYPQTRKVSIYIKLYKKSKWKL